MELCIRDFFEINDKIFSVTEYSKEEEKKVKCLLRYIKDHRGNRGKEGKSYRKLEFNESFNILKNTRFLEKNHGLVQQIAKKEEIDKVYRPEDPDNVDNKTKEVFEIFSQIIQTKKLGITGSRLLGLNKKESDIDFVIYGRKNFEKVRKNLPKLIEKTSLNKLNIDDWRRDYEKRNPPLSFKRYMWHEKRKLNTAKVGDTKLDLLFVRSRAEDWPNNEKIKEIGTLKEIEAKIIEDKYCFDFPARYKLDHNKFNEALSFTHTYAGQVFEGEKALIRGRKAGNTNKIIVGTTRKPSSEFITVK